MNKMHLNEFDINIQIVSLLVKNQYSDSAELPITPLNSDGTDHALFRLGKQFILRLPRLERAVEGINKEAEWLPKLARILKTSISEPIFKGKPDSKFPWPWLVVKWNDGQTPDFEKENEYELLAKDLAYFLNELHSLDIENGPRSRRGVPLAQMVSETRKAIAESGDEIDSRAVTTLWDELSNTPAWDAKPVWVHGDLLPGNILVKEKRLSAVIDFSDLGMGDPACDLIIAWSFLDTESRKIFKDNLKNIDENTWNRGRGWALSIALIILPYYKNSNYALAATAKHMIEALLKL